MRKYISYLINLGILLFMVSDKVYGQASVIDGSASAYVGTSYLAVHSMTLLPGFSFTASASTNFYVYIDGTEPLPQDATIPQNNAVRTDFIKTPGIHDDNGILALTTSAHQIQTEYTYMDGMGRPIQDVKSQASEGLKDVVQQITYDASGRQSTQYLPYGSTATTGAYQPNALTAQAAFYNGGSAKVAVDPNPYAVITYEASALNRVTEQGHEGQDWQVGSGHTVRSLYRLNTASDNVLIWTASGTGGYYAANLLSVTQTTDENNHITLIFKNQLGQVVLKRVNFGENITENGTTSLVPSFDTYYVYDDLGNVIYQVPPKATAQIAAGATWNAAFISQWVFSYVYDSYSRVIQKQTPGASAIYLVYNQMDQVVMTQDGNLRATNRWYCIKYDQQHRPLISGIYTYTDPNPGVSGTPQAKLQGIYNAFNYDLNDKYYEERLSTGTHAYTNQSFPTTGLVIETVNYYDTYDIYGSGTGTANFSYASQGIGDNTPAVNCNNTLTATKKAIIGSTGQWFVTVIFYDKYGRAIQQAKNNQLTTVNNTPNPATLTDNTTNVYNFDGTLAVTQLYKYVSSTNNIKVVNKISYDNWQRLSQVTQNNNNASSDQVVAKYDYNEVGQLVDRNLGKTSSGSYMQSVDYRYNIRGWVTNINSGNLTNNTNSGDAPDLFGMDISYDQTETGFIDGTTYKPYYNGEIAAVKWMVAGTVSGTARPERSYRYTYDEANRLRKSYSAALSGTTWTAELGGYNEDADYDQNGNILHLDRNTELSGSAFTMDNLTYSYVANGTNYGNQLQKVDDAVANTTGLTEFKDNAKIAQEYTYDANGNLTSDANKGSTTTPLAYTYNDVGKVSKVDFGSGNYVTYTYDAVGNRLQRLVYANNGLTATYNYLDGFIYNGTMLLSLPMPEGRVTVSSGVYQYEYIIKDYQGNARMSFIAGSSGAASLLQENHYYPFGMTMIGATVNTPGNASNPNNYLYNGGDELQQDNGSNIYSTFYREYDPAVGRFNGIDIEADVYGDTSPFAFAANNPVIFNDPLGDAYGYGNNSGGNPFQFQTPMQQWLDNANTALTTPWEQQFAFYQSLSNPTKPVQTPTGDRIWTAGDDISKLQAILDGSYSLDDDGQYEGILLNVVPIKAKVKRATPGWIHTVTGTWDSPYNVGGYPRGAIGGPVPWYGNFLGPGPDGNPFKLTGYDGKVLKPIDMLDAAAQRHDAAYDAAKVGGVIGALFRRRVAAADEQLAIDAFGVIGAYYNGTNDTVTGQSVSPLELAWAEKVTAAFLGIGGYKMLLGGPKLK